jgi:hypothetical protein
MEMPRAELFDRLSIVLLKVAHGGVEHLPEGRALARDLWGDAGEWFVDLVRVNAAIWQLEADLKAGHETRVPMIELGRRAIDIRNWNRERLALKNTITAATGSGFLDTKREHLAE